MREIVLKIKKNFKIRFSAHQINYRHGAEKTLSFYFQLFFQLPKNLIGNNYQTDRMPNARQYYAYHGGRRVVENSNLDEIPEIEPLSDFDPDYFSNFRFCIQK